MLFVVEEGCIGGRFFECYQRFNGGRKAAGTNGFADCGCKKFVSLF